MKYLLLLILTVAFFACNKEKNSKSSGINPPNWLQGELCDSLSVIEGHCDITPDYVITSDNFLIYNAGVAVVDIKKTGSMQGNSYTDELNGNLYTITLSGSGVQQTYYFENLQNGYICYTLEYPEKCVSYKKIP